MSQSSMMEHEVPSQHLSFTDLPVDLVLCICDFLSPAQITCLALCTRGLMSLLTQNGTRPLSEQLPRDKRLPRPIPADMTTELAKFLAILSTDLPEYYMCSVCCRLHLWSTVSLPGKFKYFGRRARPIKCFPYLRGENADTEIGYCQHLMVDSYVSRTGYRFDFVHLQLMMRRFHYGPAYGLSPDTAFFTQVNLHPLKSFEGTRISLTPMATNEVFDQSYLTHIFSVEARVSPATPSLILRFQDICVVSREFAPMLMPKNGPINISICNHIHTMNNVWGTSGEAFNLFSTLIEAYCGNRILDKFLGHCTKCNTEFEVEIQEANYLADTNDVTLTITRWVDLGPGLSLEDLRWTTQLAYNHMEIPPSDIIHDIRRQFDKAPLSQECGGNVSVEERYRRNMSCMKTQRYERMMRRAEGGSFDINCDFEV
ncbi:hypothetical protein N7493_009614 [Penicillium malachiteum]|uniref:F-box domain-containing protein n=1 Tax=Penicillium malachiteum TaxID=1324776 RepID=A0AAD6HEH7_9EURO|nr:hypothetical protein N7493_009614 [Penicillium malachiteum]